MNIKTRITILLNIMTIIVISCSRDIQNVPAPPMEERSIPTPASTMQELIRNMSSDDMTVRLVSIYELGKYGNGAVVAIPALIDNLYVEDYDVRVAAAIALGRLGSNAQLATQDLIYMLQNDHYIHARDAAATALGYIGKRQAVPYLALALYDDNPYKSYNVPISSAVSITKITGEKFSDSDSTTGYRLNEDGIPLIVIDARIWWLEIGQFQDWVAE